MFQINGKYNTAKVYAGSIDSQCLSQIIELCSQEWIKDSNIAIMADCHAGKGCVIGFTATIKDKICPNLVGTDIGCGMLTVELGNIDIDFTKLDNYLRGNVNGMQKDTNFDFTALRCYPHLNLEISSKYTGTLGSGNHFVEIDRDEENNKYLIIHSGSRNLGQQVCRYYQNIAEEKCRDKNVNNGLAYLEETDMENYIHDLVICQMYAEVNRKLIAIPIMRLLLGNKLPISMFHTIHNYYDADKHIIRKGAISANKNELVLIPMNMRDGCILAKGKGNLDYNYSAPHGAGRKYSRSEAKESITLEEFQKSMEGIFTTCVNNKRIDESPMAYKPMEEIIESIEDTVDIVKILKPIYNYKAR